MLVSHNVGEEFQFLCVNAHTSGLDCLEFPLSSVRPLASTSGNIAATYRGSEVEQLVKCCGCIDLLCICQNALG